MPVVIKKTFNYKIIRNYCFENRDPGNNPDCRASSGDMKKYPSLKKKI